MKPIIVIPQNTMAQSEIKLLRENGLCVVVAKDPAKVRFMDPIPAAQGRTAAEQAAISLSRKVLSPGTWNSEETRQTVASWYCDILIKGTSLDPQPTETEINKRYFDQAKRDEMIRLGREEARSERAAAKAKASTPKEAEKSPAS